jgi:hypothetical protein
MTAPLRRNGILVATIRRGCEAKHRHPDELVARAMALTQQEMSGYRMFVYPCKICRGWHLTKQEQRDKRRAADHYEPTPR